MPVVLQGHNAIINAETGSGKTLCKCMAIQMVDVISGAAAAVGFLLPIINKLMVNNSPVKAPFSFILVPTAELAMQVEL